MPLWINWKYFWNWTAFGAAPATQLVNASEQLIKPIRPLNLGSLINAQTGATYTVSLSTDRGKALILSNAGGAAVTLPDPTGASDSATFEMYCQNIGALAATLTPAGGKTIDGQANITLAQFKGAILFTDGTNWFTVRA